MSIKDTERFKRLQALFDQAMDLAPDEADQLLKAQCAGDMSLLVEARRLLELHRGSRAALDQPPLPGALSGLLTGRAIAVGDVLASRFRITQFLGEGGIGEVYEAEDTLLEQTLAIKTLHPFHAAEAGTRDRFRREIQLARRISHNSICRIYDFYAAEVSFLTMERLQGETLQQRLKGGALPEAAALPILRDLASGLHAAHRQGVLHRDLKPSNVMLCPDRAVIMDFGLALLLDRHDPTGATLPSSTLGTPAYMSPEQLEGRKLSPASDVYSLGVVLYEMLVGRAPHVGLSPLAIAARRVQEPPPSPKEANSQVSAAWDAVVRRALEVNPERRYASAPELLQALEGGAPLWRVPRPGRRVLLTGAGIAALGAGSAAVLLRLSRYEPQTESARWFAMGQTALDTQSPQAAARLFEKALESDPHHLLARVRLAEALIEQDRNERAKDQLMQVDSALARQWWPDRGLQQANEAAKALAVRDFDRARQLTTGLARVRVDIHAAEFASARKALQELTAANPQNAAAWLQLALTETRLQDRSAALASLRKADEIFSAQRNLEALIEVDQLRAANLEIGEAKAVLDKALGVARSLGSPAAEARVLFTRSRVMQLAGEGDEAIQAAEQARGIAGKAQLEELAISGLIDLANAWSTQYRMKEMEQLLLDAIPRAEALHAYYLAARARFILAQALSRFPMEGAEVKPLLDQAAAWFRENGMSTDLQRVLNWTLLIDVKEARYAEARRKAVELRALAEARGNDLGALDADEIIAETDERSARFAEAISRYRTTAEAHQRAERLQKAAYDWINGAVGAMRWGDRATAHDFLNRAGELLKEQPHGSAPTLHQLTAAQLALTELEYGEALRLARSVEERSRNRSTLRILLARSCEALAMAGMGQTAAALQLASDTTEAARGEGMLTVYSQIRLREMHVLWLTGRRDEARRLAREALPWFVEKQHVEEAAEARLLLGEKDDSSARQIWGNAAYERFRSRPDLKLLLKGLP